MTCRDLYPECSTLRLLKMGSTRGFSTVEELAADAAACVATGASLIHLHPRDEIGRGGSIPIS